MKTVVPMILYFGMLVTGIILGYLLASRIASIRIRHFDLLWRERLNLRVREEISKREGDIRREAATRSGRALSGRVLERFSPLMEQFPFDPHDAVWIGYPIDFLVFDGLSLDRDEGRQLKRIVLVEVKSGSGRLSRRQRTIKEIVDGGKVNWEQIKIAL